MYDFTLYFNLKFQFRISSKNSNFNILVYPPTTNIHALETPMEHPWNTLETTLKDP